MSRWSEEEIEILKLNISIEEKLTLLPNRSRSAIISKMTYDKPRTQRRVGWSKADKQLLADFYDIENFNDLKQRFPGRTEGSIRAQASRLRKDGWVFNKGD